MPSAHRISFERFVRTQRTTSFEGSVVQIEPVHIDKSFHSASRLRASGKSRARHTLGGRARALPAKGKGG
jgi:hypothetical protein